MKKTTELFIFEDHSVKTVTTKSTSVYTEKSIDPRSILAKRDNDLIHASYRKKKTPVIVQIFSKEGETERDSGKLVGTGIFKEAQDKEVSFYISNDRSELVRMKYDFLAFSRPDKLPLDFPQKRGEIQLYKPESLQDENIRVSWNLSGITYRRKYIGIINRDRLLSLSFIYEIHSKLEKWESLNANIKIVEQDKEENIPQNIVSLGRRPLRGKELVIVPHKILSMNFPKIYFYNPLEGTLEEGYRFRAKYPFFPGEITLLKGEKEIKSKIPATKNGEIIHIKSGKTRDLEIITSISDNSLGEEIEKEFSLMIKQLVRKDEKKKIVFTIPFEEEVTRIEPEISHEIIDGCVIFSTIISQPESLFSFSIYRN